jgi:hypothetical protein
MFAQEGQPLPLVDDLPGSRARFGS